MEGTYDIPNENPHFSATTVTKSDGVFAEMQIISYISWKLATLIIPGKPVRGISASPWAWGRTTTRQGSYWRCGCPGWGGAGAPRLGAACWRSWRRSSAAAHGLCHDSAEAIRKDSINVLWLKTKIHCIIFNNLYLFPNRNEHWMFSAFLSHFEKILQVDSGRNRTYDLLITRHAVLKLMQSLSRNLRLNIIWYTVRLTVYSNAAVCGENEYGKSGHLSIFTLLKHFMMLLKYNFFQGFSLTPYQRH